MSRREDSMKRSAYLREGPAWLRAAGMTTTSTLPRAPEPHPHDLHRPPRTPLFDFESGPATHRPHAA